MLYIMILTYTFKIEFNFEMWISQKRWEVVKKIIMYDIYRGSYLPSNGTIANVTLHDLDLNFQVQTFQVAILISKGWKMQTLL